MIDKERCTDKMEIIESHQMDSKKSPWGNNFLRVDMSHITALLDGKVLFYHDGEYGTYIAYSEEREKE